MSDEVKTETENSEEVKAETEKSEEVKTEKEKSEEVKTGTEKSEEVKTETEKLEEGKPETEKSEKVETETKDGTKEVTDKQTGAKPEIADSDFLKGPAGIKLYISSMSSSRDVKTKQQRMLHILESKKVPFEKVDIATDHIGRAVMRRLCKNPKALPPIITKGEALLGDFQTFLDAVDDEILEKFLGLT